MSRNEIKADPYLENAARQLTALNRELRGELSPDEDFIKQTKQFERVHVFERGQRLTTAEGSWKDRYYAAYTDRVSGKRLRVQCQSLYGAQQIAGRYRDGKVYIVGPCEEN